MKTNSRTGIQLVALLLVVLVTAVSCKKDEESPNPDNPKEKFLGSWNCAESSKLHGNTSNFEVHIVDAGGDSLLIENFYALGFNKKARSAFSGSTLTLKPNTFVTGGSGLLVVSGAGSISGTTINMAYVVNDGNANDSCTAVITFKNK